MHRYASGSVTLQIWRLHSNCVPAQVSSTVNMWNFNDKNCQKNVLCTKIPTILMFWKKIRVIILWNFEIIYIREQLELGRRWILQRGSRCTGNARLGSKEYSLGFRVVIFIQGHTIDDNQSSIGDSEHKGAKMGVGPGSRRRRLRWTVERRWTNEPEANQRLYAEGYNKNVLNRILKVWTRIDSQGSCQYEKDICKDHRASLEENRIEGCVVEIRDLQHCFVKWNGRIGKEPLEVSEERRIVKSPFTRGLTIQISITMF